MLADPSLDIYECGRQDIATGQIDRRVLALLEYLVGRGYKLTITSLKCGHSTLTTSGNVSEHTIGCAVDIAVINGVPVYGHQGPGTLADSLVRDILQLQGTMVPHQIISLMDYFDADNTFAMADHDDHVHVGYAQSYAPTTDGASAASSEQLAAGPQAGAVAAADRPARRDRQPAGLGEAVALLAAGAQAGQAGLAGARQRVAGGGEK